METIETVYGEAELLEVKKTPMTLPSPHTLTELRVRVLSTGEEKWIDDGDLVLQEGWDANLF